MKLIILNCFLIIFITNYIFNTSEKFNVKVYMNFIMSKYLICPPFAKLKLHELYKFV